MVYAQALADRAAAWLALPLNEKRSGAGLTELGSLWAAIQGLPPVDCRQCQYSDRARAVAAYPREFLLFSTPSAMSDTSQTSSYQLAPAYANQTLTHEDFAGPLTAENLTDEAAEFFISKGYGHAFLKRTDTGVAAVGTGSDSTNETDEDEPEATEREKELQAEVDEAKQKLADQTTSYNTAYGQVKDALTSEQTAHTATTAALDSEKTAHAATKNQLSETQQQVTTLTAQVAQLTQDLVAAKAKKPKPQPDASTDGTSA